MRPAWPGCARQFAHRVVERPALVSQVIARARPVRGRPPDQQTGRRQSEAAQEIAEQVVQSSVARFHPAGTNRPSRSMCSNSAAAWGSWLMRGNARWSTPDHGATQQELPQVRAMPSSTSSAR
jgi:hypothetical protein